jgi:hypothetical protein
MFRLRVAAAYLLLSIGCYSASAAQTLLYLNSQPGDYIGQGIQQTLTPADGTFSVQTSSNGGLQVAFNTPNYSSWWYLNFGPPTRSKLTKSVYEGAQRFAFHSPTKPGIDVYGNGRGCNVDVGRFLVSQLTFATDGSVQSLAIDFEQHCEGMVPALYGSVRINSTVTLVPRVSVADATALKGNVGTNGANIIVSLSMPSTQPVSVQYSTKDGTALQGRDYVASTGTVQFQPGITSRPITIPVVGDRLARGNKLFHVALTAPNGAPIGDANDNVKIFDPNAAMKVLAMYGEPGDYISPGVFLATIADGVFTPTRNYDNGVSIALSAGDMWQMDFAAPNNATIVKGAYDNAQRFPFQSPAVPGLSVYGAGRGCNTLTGRFVVSQVGYNTVTGAVQQFSADFEQHCEGGIPGLFGSIRWNTKMRQFSVSDAAIDTVNSTATFTVTVNPASSNSVSVDFATLDGTAVSSIDYVSTSQTVSFAPGQTQQTITVPLLTSNAGGKQFFGLLTAPSGAPVWIKQGVATF